MQFATNPPSGEFIPPTVMGYANYFSTLHSTEINWVHSKTDWLNCLAGFRWIELGEDINGQTQNNIDVGGIFHNNVNNHLYGFQLGVEAFLWESQRGCMLDGFAKAGIYGNHASHSAKYTARSSSWWNHASQGTAAFVGEVGLTCSWDIFEWLTVRCGYEALWISGVALASNQVPITPTTNHHGAITVGGSAFYHGGLLQFVIYR